MAKKMNTNYREMLGMNNLRTMLGVNSLNKDLNMKQKKAIRNIEYCANDQWGWVNTWNDERSESARAFMMDAKELFYTIYADSLENVYDEGFCAFGAGAKSYLKDIRFCGKEFLQKVALYFTAKLLEESLPEVEGTEEDSEKALNDLRELKGLVGC